MKLSNSLMIAGLSLGIVTTGVGLIYKSHSRGQDIQNVAISKNTETVTGIKLDVNTIQSDVRHIKEDIKESRQIQQKVLDKLDDIKTYVHDLNIGD